MSNTLKMHVVALFFSLRVARFVALGPSFLFGEQWMLTGD